MSEAREHLLPTKICLDHDSAHDDSPVGGDIVEHSETTDVEGTTLSVKAIVADTAELNPGVNKENEVPTKTTTAVRWTAFGDLELEECDDEDSEYECFIPKGPGSPPSASKKGPDIGPQKQKPKAAQPPAGDGTASTSASSTATVPVDPKAKDVDPKAKDADSKAKKQKYSKKADKTQPSVTSGGKQSG